MIIILEFGQDKKIMLVVLLSAYSKILVKFLTHLFSLSASLQILSDG